MSDCRFGVSPVNYPDPDPDPEHTPSNPIGFPQHLPSSWLSVGKELSPSLFTCAVFILVPS